MTDEKYINILSSVLDVCKVYKPKLGHGRKEGYSLSEFKSLYGQDPFYGWMGLDSDLMYAAHKAAGGMTSVYRQIGIGCERIFREVLKGVVFEVRQGYKSKDSKRQNADIANAVSAYTKLYLPCVSVFVAANRSRYCTSLQKRKVAHPYRLTFGRSLQFCLCIYEENCGV